MEGGGAMEGRGSGVEDWRGEAHLGSSLPVSAHRRPCPLVFSCVHKSCPVSACHCPCLRDIPCVCMSLPVSVHRCLCPHVLPVSAHRSPCPFTFVGSRFCLWVWVVAFVHGQLSLFMGGPSSFVGNSRVWWWGAIGWWW